jgi:hypothetical protein
MAKLKRLSIDVGDAGHSVRHEFASAAKKMPGGSLGMDRPASQEHNFGPGEQEQHRLMTHIAGALGFKKVAAAEGKEDAEMSEGSC